MSKYTFNEIFEHLRQELTLTEAKARGISNGFTALCIETEVIKLDALRSYLEEQRKSSARDRGINYLIKDRRRIRNSLLVVAGSFIIGGLLSRDKFVALNAGISGFDGMVQGFGESK